jgi:hypothetical protein
MAVASTDVRIGAEFQANVSGLGLGLPMASLHYVDGASRAYRQQEDWTVWPAQHWTKADSDAFVLGTRLFDKKFKTVRRLVGNKEVRLDKQSVRAGGWGPSVRRPPRDSWEELELLQ